MPVNAISTYVFAPSDAEAAFHGARVVYVGWDHHLLFSSPYAWPLSPDLPIMLLIGGPLAQAFAQHPDWSHIDWRSVVWTKNGEPFQLDLGGTVASNGLEHKDALRFSTPGLNGINGAGL